MMRAEAIAAIGGTIGTVLSAAIPEVDQLEAIGKWPLVLIMAVITVTAVYLMYKSNRDSSKDRLEEARMHKESIANLAKALVDSCDKISEKESRVESLLAQRPCIRDPNND